MGIPMPEFVRNLAIKVVEYRDKKYMEYEKSSNPVQYINETLKLIKVLTAINNAVKKADSSKFELDLENEEWVLSYKRRLLELLRKAKGRTENSYREDTDRYTRFLISKQATYLSDSPDENQPGLLYYSNNSRLIYLVNPDEIKFLAIYKNFPEKIFWLKENVKKAQEDFNIKQIKMYGDKAKDWSGKPVNSKLIKEVLDSQKRPGGAERIKESGKGLKNNENEEEQN